MDELAETFFPILRVIEPTVETLAERVLTSVRAAVNVAETETEDETLFPTIL